MLNLKEYLFLLFPFIVVFIFIPSELFHYNITEWDDDIYLIVMPAIVSILLYTCLLFFIYFTKIVNSNIYKKIKSSLPWLFVNIGIFILLADVLAPLQLTQLDGSNLKSTEPLMITLIEVIILICIVFLYKFKIKIEKIVLDLVIVFIIISTIYFAFNLYSVSYEEHSNETSKISDKAYKNKLPNIYHLHLDAMQTNYFLENLKDAQLKNNFKGFTLFKNNISNYPYSLPSVASYLTSTTYNSKSYKKWLKRFDQGLLSDLEKIGYKINIVGKKSLLYTDKATSFVSNDEIYKEKTKIKHPMQKQFLSIIMARILPNFYTNKALKLGEKLNDLFVSKGNDLLTYPTTIKEGIEPYIGVEILKYINNTEKNRDEFGEYLLAQPIIPHAPYVMNKECVYSELGDTVKSQYMQQVQCATSLVNTFIDTLKKLNRYDNSIIIIHGDHGSGTAGFINEEQIEYSNTIKKKQKSVYNKDIRDWSQTFLEARSMALLMIKPANINHMFKISSVKTDLLDIYPTIMNLVNITKKNTVEGNDLSGVLVTNKEHIIKNNKKHFFYYFKSGWDEKEIVEKIEVDFINNRPNFINSNITHYTPEYSWDGSELPSQIGISQNSYRVVRGVENKKAFITFGPYISLSSGNYTFKYTYKSSLLETQVAGKLDVNYNKGKKRIVIEDVYGTNGKTSSIEGKFKINTNDKIRLEVRMFYNGKGDFSAQNLTIQKK